MEQGKKDQILSLVSALRAQLTEASLRFIKPSLIIFDEFHRFKNLLPSETEEGDEAAELAKPLFKRADSSVLLMSATPYKMYTLDLEAEDHHQDFLHTIGILFGSRTEKAERVGEILRLRRQELNRWGSLKPDPALKSELEETLLEVMCRTERIRGSSQAAPKLEETEKNLKVTPGDIMDMAAADAVASAAKAACPVEYWKSAPYLLNFLRDYDLRRKLDAAAMKPSKELLDALEKALPKTLPGSSLSGWEKIDPANPRMRALFERTLDRGMWRLLWMPASLPYSLPAGPWSDLADATKTLIFSRWRAVPESISALCSYEAERLMAAESGKRRPYSCFVDDHAAPLRIASRSFTPASLNALGWMLPWPALALSADPLELALENKGPLPLKKMRSLAQAKIRPLLKELPRHGGKGPSDQRWYWAAAGMLENASTSSSPGGAPGAWPSWLESDQCSSALSKDEEKGAENVKKRLANLAALAGGQWETLGPKPADIEKVLADMALAGPGICALRAMGRLDQRCPPEKAYRNRDNLSRAASIASGLRTLFNLAETESLLGGPPAASYFQAALKCSLEGNLQAVLDEHAHILWDSTGPSQDPSDRLLSVEENLTSALSLRAVSETIDFLETSEAKLKIIPRKTRRRFALSFLETTCAKSAQEDRENKRHERVRTAFNSPFRPFVLASTSIGQEGLDFHSWCHAVVHWNLPSNPVDLEQREGRVDRYKGYAVRKNIAASYGLKALSKLESVKDPWEALFRLAAADRPEGASELAPYWIFENGPAKIERVIPLPVLSRDVAILRRLKRGLALYRMVFGQSRQEDLALSLERSIEKTENADFSDWLISLEPPKKGGPGVSR